MIVPLNVPQHVVEDIAMEQAVSRASSANPSAHRSPSAVPALELEEAVSKEEQLTSERYRSLLPSIEEQIYTQTPISSQQTSQQQADSNKIVLGVPLLGHQRDQYQTTRESLTPSGTATLQRLRDIVIHPDLDNVEALDHAVVDADQQVEWDTQSSAKFRWLKLFLDLVWQTDFSIALAISAGKRERLLKRFLTALYTLKSGQISISVCTEDSSVSISRDIDLIVRLDDTALSSDVTQLQLIVPYTIEHIELDHPTQSEDQVRAFRHQAGRLDEGLPDIAASAATIAGYLVSGSLGDTNELVQLSPLDLSTMPNDHNAKRAYDDSDSESFSAKRIKSEDPGGTNDIESRTRSLLMVEQRRREDLEGNLDDLQFRLEEMQKQLSEVIQERDAAIKTAQQAVTRMNDQADHLRTLKSSIIDLRTKLDESDMRFVDHAIPERAENEALRQAAAKATDGEQKAVAKVEGMKKDLLYAQSMYQDASTKASGLAGENEIMARQLALTEAAASKERAHLRQMGFDNVAKQLHRDNKQLRTLLDLRELALTSRDEEILRLKDTNRGRVSTRGSSVPRSPRMSSPLKTMDVKLASSRHVSPTAPEARHRAHPLRNV